MVPPMAGGAAKLPFFLDVRHLAARRHFTIAADDAAAAESGEAEKSNETHFPSEDAQHRGANCVPPYVLSAARSQATDPIAS